jgi:hypothetical protein
MTQPRQAELDPRSRRQRRKAAAQARAEARERRWADRRFAVPYDIEGPKVTLGALWFVAVVAAAVFHPLALWVVVAPVAMAAATQSAQAWRHDVAVSRPMTALLAGAVPEAGAAAGVTGLGAAVILATLVVLVGSLLSEGALMARSLRLAEVGVRVSVPVGLAAGAMVALARIGPVLLLSLVLVVSAYEMGDFLIGTGSTNAVEGPVSGMVSALIVGAVVVLAAPPSIPDPLVAVGAAVVLAPLGQVLASAVLPRGAAWAPALRRLDSYLLAAPLWVFLA